MTVSPSSEPAFAELHVCRNVIDPLVIFQILRRQQHEKRLGVIIIPALCVPLANDKVQPSRKRFPLRGEREHAGFVGFPAVCGRKLRRST